ncbi:MAG: hypothetical protein CML55_07870 [Rhodobacteraceae bacterium]|nr:hypothetical protein [Paracoccaceae bacterium]
MDILRIGSLGAALVLWAGVATAVTVAETRLTPPDSAPYDNYGFSVALLGPNAIVGRLADRDRGSAYLFDRSTGLQLATLTGPDAMAFDQFGVALAFSGTTAIVRSFGGGGSAYLFDLFTRAQIRRLIASDEPAGDDFVFSAVFSGNTAIVGTFEGDDGGIVSGSAYLFDISTGTQIAGLTASDAAAFGQSGRSVARSETTAILRNRGGNDAGPSSDSPYLFDASARNQISNQSASEASAGDNSGSSVARSGSTAAVRAFSNGNDGFESGSPYLFDASTRPKFSKLMASDAAAFDYFGPSVALFGTTAVVGANRGNEGDSASIYEGVDATPTVVPVPTGIWLLLTGLGGLMALRRPA